MSGRRRDRSEFTAAFDGVSEPQRREVLKAMGASLGLAALSGCSNQPDEAALPYVHAPEFQTPGKARHYATAVTPIGGYAQAVLGTTFEGRPTKLEGLPGHSCNGGTADAFTQAAILGLYDPDRSQAPRHEDEPTEWGAFDAMLAGLGPKFDADGGAGLRLLIGQSTSPTLARQLAEIGARWPRSRWHGLEPCGEALALEASRQVFGRPLAVLPHLDQAHTVICLDADPLGPGPAQVRNARLWAQRRNAYQRGDGASRLLVAEPTPTLTGVKAQHRLACAQGRIGLLAQALAGRLGLGGGEPVLVADEAAFLDRAQAAIAAAPGAALVLVGGHQPIAVQALGLAINQHLAAPLSLIEPPAPVPPDGPDSFARLKADMAAGIVDTLLILQTNPAYIDPGFDFTKARLVIHAGLYRDETARRAHWHAPIEHPLETWSDARAVDGAVSLIQPLVKPFWSVRSPHVLIEALLGRPSAIAREVVASGWRTAWGDRFEDRWRAALGQGWIEGSAAAPVTVAAHPMPGSVAPKPSQGLELILRPDPCIWDGRFANNAWLQELPKPLNKLTWDNALAISPALAQQLKLQTGDLVRINGVLEAPVWVTPGQAAQTVTAHLGYGRNLPGQLGDGHGFDAFRLTPGAVRLERTGKRARLATTQPHQQMAGEEVRTTTAAQGRQARPPTAKVASFYPDVPRTSPAWGMSIDEDLCIGCNACVVGCNAENNVPMVGKTQVADGRFMHWLRIDAYHQGDPAQPDTSFQPVPCMHCEDAPCEMGCPVHASVHSPDGLNLQVYNRCIGTRTCSSYCPYKVRRFNWFDWTEDDAPSVQAQRNPNVTVRSRGVMEKCTYCIQRISQARINADLENRPIREGEVVTACQQTCPTGAIVFGDVASPDSAVSRRKAQARDYSLLEEYNTRPRTTYLARLKDEEG